MKGMPFNFAYIVDDEATENFQTRQEEGDKQGVVTGCFQVLDPNGLVRTTTYRADDTGFHIISLTRSPDKTPCPGERLDRLLINSSRASSHTSRHYCRYHEPPRPLRVPSRPYKSLELRQTILPLPPRPADRRLHGLTAHEPRYLRRRTVSPGNTRPDTDLRFPPLPARSMKGAISSHTTASSH
ncbi:hypothetical protein O3P69_004068 [Scylla paramamosain]|uniref:Cuticle protein n=1 Tax=Scylla paramamosain TaxID=85552 RepID=A0AAW0UEY4_SCYPA